LNYIGAYYKGDTLRKISLTPLSDITDSKELDAVIKSNANSILFIIPKEINEKIRDLIEYLQISLSKLE
jgi:hypothetical protein